MRRIETLAAATGAANDDEQARLEIGAETVLRLTQLLYSEEEPGNRPQSYERVCMRLSQFAGPVSETDYRSVHEIAAAHGIVVGRMVDRWALRAVPDEVARHLQLGPGELVMEVDGLVRTAAGEPIEWRVAFLRETTEPQRAGRNAP